MFLNCDNEGGNALLKYKKSEVLHMTNLNENTRNNELEYYAIGINDASGKAGITNVVVTSHIVEDDDFNESTLYAAEIETVSEIVAWNKGFEAVYDALYGNASYNHGDYELIKTFDNETDALAYVNENYPRVDVKQLVQDKFID